MTGGSEIQTGIAEEAEEQMAVAADAVGGEMRGEVHRSHVGLAAVGQLPALEVGPEPLGGVQLRCVAGQPPDLEPILLPGQELLHAPAPVRGQPVPEQDHLLASEVAMQLANELDQREVVVVAFAGLEVEPTPAAIPAVGEGNGHRDAIPVEGMAEDRGMAPGCPGPPDNGRQRGSGLVLEDDPGSLPPGPFFMAGHSSRTQSLIACSSRSMASRAGFCQLHRSRFRIRQAWPMLYRTPVSIAITSATRSRVQSSVLQPWARGPLSSARSTCRSSFSVSSGGRPARSARFRPWLPSASQARCQTLVLCLETPNWCATSAGCRPLAKSRAACSRRSSSAWRSAGRRPLIPSLPLLERMFMMAPPCHHDRPPVVIQLGELL